MKKKIICKGKSCHPSEKNRLVELFNQGRYAELEPLLRSMTEQFSHDGFAWKLLGVLLSKAGNSEEALQCKQKAARLSPDDPDVHNNLGNSLKELGRFEEAEACFRRALKLRPHLAEIQNNLGQVLADLGRFTEAESCFRRALQSRPDFALAYNNLGSICKEKKQLAEAEACYRKAVQSAPGYAEAYSNLGATLKELGRLQEAESCIMQALQLNPGFAPAHNNLANLLKDAGLLDQAELHYRKAIAIRPDYAEAHTSLANTLCDLGRSEEAEGFYRSALESTAGKVSSASQQALHSYGLWLAELDRHEEAVRCHQQAFAERTGYQQPLSENKELSSGLVFAMLELTNRCNFHCDFCPSDLQQRPLCTMEPALVRRAADELADKKLAKQIDLHLMGEPTLHPDLLELLDYIASKGIKTELVTNGSTLNAENIPKLLDALEGELVISLQTPTEASYRHRGTTGLAWERYISTIRLLVREYLNGISRKQRRKNTVALRVMITKDSDLSAHIIESVEDILAALQEWYTVVAALEVELGLQPFKRKALMADIQIVPATFPLQQGLSLVFWKGFSFANTLLDNGYRLEYKEAATFCCRPFLDLAVLSNGDVTLCCLDYDGQLKVGSMYGNTTIEEILHGKPARDLRAAMLGHHPLPPFCQQCQARAFKVEELKS